MVKKIIDEKEFEISEVDYGTILDLQDKHTLVDDEGRERLLKGKYTKELILKYVKDSEGKPVDIHNSKQVPMMTAAKLDQTLGKMFKPQEIKNN